jgi:hypothetical protein
LAVKDLIDVKGVVTTAGSKYIAKTAAPALRPRMILTYSNAGCSDGILEPGRLLLTTEHSPCSYYRRFCVNVREKNARSGHGTRLAAIWKRPAGAPQDVRRFVK